MKCEIITGELRERPPGPSTELVEKADESPTKRTGRCADLHENLAGSKKARTTVFKSGCDLTLANI